jgi:histidine ammonia-lyase
MSETTRTVVIGQHVRLEDVHAVAQGRAHVTLDSNVRDSLQGARDELLSDLDEGETIYGVNTGFGALSDTRIPDDRIEELQRNLLRSHAVGVGPHLGAPVVRALLLLRAHTLSLGACGASPALLEHILAVLSRGIVPIVPSQGSVGASGDLAPLAHLALPLIGEGEAWVDSERVPGRVALAKVGLEPFVLGPKEGLSLINGTQVTSAIGGLATWSAAEVLATADVVGAMSLDAGLNTKAAFDPRIHAGKPHPGQIHTADVVRDLVTDSPLVQSHADCDEVQDAYSIRCMPQVHGAVRGALAYVHGALDVELNSFTDNPLVLAREGGGYDVVSGGNFHASTVAVPLDHLAAAMTTLATISERRLDRFMSPSTSRGLPPFLADDPGVESGFMMAQVTAAALASECKSLSFPASVDSIPTSAGKEDHVSMGPIAARKLTRVVHNVAKVLAIEAAIAARALDLRKHPTTPRLIGVYDAIRRHVPPHTGDRSMGEELETLAEAILQGELRKAALLEHEFDGDDLNARTGERTGC